MSKPGVISQDKDVVDGVVMVYLAALRGREVPDRAAWLARYPQWAAELTAFWSDYDWSVERFAPLRLLSRLPS